MKDVNLSKRMEAVVNMVSPQSFAIADVGCDHAYVSIALIQRKKASKVVAMDVRIGPLDIARKNVVEAGFSDVIDIRLGDGLGNLETDEVDGIIIAGMGGLLMKGILERGVHILNSAEKRPTLILQPQSDLKEVRMFLQANAYHIVCETMLVEDGKYYTIIKAEPDGAKEHAENTGYGKVETFEEKPYSEEEWVYGRCNLVARSEILLDFLEREQKVLQQILTKVEMSIQKSVDANEEIAESTKQRLESVKQEIECNAKALRYYE